jgi:hypothetical protein
MITNPAEYDIDVYQDRDFSYTFIIKDLSGVLVDIDDWTVTAQIRPTYDSDTLIANFYVVTDTVLSSITMTLSDDVTRAITAENPISASSTTTSTNMVWDMVVDSAGPPTERFTIITGICNFNETVTRST